MIKDVGLPRAEKKMEKGRTKKMSETDMYSVLPRFFLRSSGGGAGIRARRWEIC